MRSGERRARDLRPGNIQGFPTLRKPSSNPCSKMFGSVLTLVVIEVVVSIRAGRWNRRDSTTSVGVGIGYLAIKAIAADGVKAVMLFGVSHHKDATGSDTWNKNFWFQTHIFLSKMKMCFFTAKERDNPNRRNCL